jgi:hypothetical protein
MAGRFPPTYSPPPQSQRINDAVAEAERQAKDQLDEARRKIEQQLGVARVLLTCVYVTI